MSTRRRLSVAEADALIDILAYEVNPLKPE